MTDHNPFLKAPRFCFVFNCQDEPASTALGSTAGLLSVTVSGYVSFVWVHLKNLRGQKVGEHLNGHVFIKFGCSSLGVVINLLSFHS